MTDNKNPKLYPWQEKLMQEPRNDVYPGGQPPNPAVDTRLLHALSEAIYAEAKRRKHIILAGSYEEFKIYCRIKRYDLRDCIPITDPIKAAGLERDIRFEYGMNFEKLLVENLGIMLRFGQIHEWLSFPENRSNLVSLFDEQITLADNALRGAQAEHRRLTSILNMLASKTAKDQVGFEMNKQQNLINYWFNRTTQFKTDKFVLGTYWKLK